MPNMTVVFSDMAPRMQSKPSVTKANPIGQVIAESVRRYRLARTMTQADLSEGMIDLGFTTWSRSTVAEVEGKGRGRGISFVELIGLAQMLGVTVADMLIPSFIDNTSGAIELAPGLVVATAADLLTMILPPDLLAGVFEAGLNREANRLREIESNRLYGVASQLRDAATEFEATADKLTVQAEETK